MKYTLYTLLAALFITSCNKYRSYYSLTNPCDRSVCVRFYQSKEDYLTCSNILGSVIIGPNETKKISLENFPLGDVYKEYYTEDYKFASWPEEPTYAFTHTKVAHGSNEQISFMGFDSGRPAPGVFLRDGAGSFWKAVSRNGEPVSGDKYTMTIRKDLTAEFNYDTTHIQTTYWFYTDTYGFGVGQPGLLIHGNEHFSIMQGESGNYLHMPWIYNSPVTGSDSVVVFYDGDELMYRRVRFL